ncbi:alpha/beta hydrolase [Rhizobium viscosum]|uniref:Pimeloyl-ACP methyl ester carboxylesterase n=1 Tax=Rhizobium viscosum TaxID=1673 RepID=A0ABR9ITG5_RHIVS|nr:alpha/beta hydrolase [Rhizobium viscosum]MBE1506488.1 pimeloyl-ACP methyl ester carboxylesterase [Rhizobium viscosum]
MQSPSRQQFRLSNGRILSFVTAGAPPSPPILLLHGFPSSSRTFRDIIPRLSGVAQVIAPDLPGFGESEVLPSPSFSAFAEAISELLEQLGIGLRHIYLHDFGAPVGFDIAMRAPDDVLGLIIQNANAHMTGQGPAWAATQAFWSAPSRENEAAATAHLTFEGIRDQYVAGVPDDVAARMAAESWEEDWRVMQLPGRMETQRALIADYGNYVSKFAAIADYLATYQPASLMIWGRHDPFFELRETLSWMEALPRMETHILDGGHFLLETHAPVAAQLIAGFLSRNR